jgi:hypothetical protein
MGCHSSKAAPHGQALAGNTLLGNRSQGLAKAPDESTTAVDTPTPDVPHSKSVGSARTAQTVQSPCGARYKKQGTVSLKREDVDVLVTKFTCNTKIHAKDIAWRVQASRDLPPLEINAHVDKSILSRAEVSVTCDDEKLFPSASDLAKGKLLEDFRYQWPFRGTLREGLNEPRRFELRHPQTQLWYPAIITKQRGDGLFEAILEMPDSNGVVRLVRFPAVSKKDIREIGSEETLHLSE